MKKTITGIIMVILLTLSIVGCATQAVEETPTDPTPAEESTPTPKSTEEPTEEPTPAPTEEAKPIYEVMLTEVPEGVEPPGDFELTDRNELLVEITEADPADNPTEAEQETLVNLFYANKKQRLSC